MKSKKIVLLLAAVAMSAILFSQNYTVKYRVTPWLNNKDAAVSLTLDDWMSSQINNAIPMLMQKKFSATFFVKTNKITNWDDLVKACDNGFEIANHTQTHPSLPTLNDAQIKEEVGGARKLIGLNNKNRFPVTFAYPGGGVGKVINSEQNIHSILLNYCIGARDVGSSPYPFNLEFWGPQPFTNDNYFKIGSQIINDFGPDIQEFNSILDAAILHHGWYVTCYHGIGGEWISTSINNFEAQLNALEQKKGRLWITTFKEAFCYHKERHCQKLEVISENAESLKLNLTDTLRDNAVFNQPLTIRMKNPAGKIRSISQGNIDVPFVNEKDTVQFNVVPDAGTIIIKYAKIRGTANLEKRDRNNGSIEYYPIRNVAKAKIILKRKD
ncbi:MAG: polysaccharide deacetylase family protein [Bacteroidota bacterium]